MGYFSDMAIGGTIGEMLEDRRLDQADGLPTRTERRDRYRAGLCADCGNEPRLIGQQGANCHRAERERMAAFEREQAARRSQRQRDGEAAGVAAAIAQAAERGIKIGSTVTRKAGGARGTVIALSMACSHGQREYVHQGRERLACQYKPRVEVGIEWEMSTFEQRHGRYGRAVSVILLSGVVLAEG